MTQPNPFQTTVSTAQGFGIPGELFLDGPTRAQPGVIMSSGSPNPNNIGYAYTQVASTDGQATIGGAITDTTPFYGILANPKTQPSLGTSAGALAPTLALPQYSNGEFMQESAGLTIQLSAPASVGDIVGYNTTTGALVTRPPNAAVTASITTTVLTVTATAGAPIAPGAPVSGPGVTPGTIVTGYGTGAGGVGTYNINNSQTVASESMTVGSLPASAPPVACTGAITATTLTVSAMAAGSGLLGVGSVLSGTTSPCTITALGTGLGGTGTYTVSVSQSFSSGAITAPALAAATAGVTNDIPGKARVTRYNITNSMGGPAVISMNANP